MFSAPREVVFGPSRGRARLDLAELWAHRELLLFLAWRDVKVRYKQTIIGIAWSVLKPAASVLVFWLLFGTLLGVLSDGVPYPLFAYTALLPWLFFTDRFTRAGQIPPLADLIAARAAQATGSPA